jgi:ParB-like chromosome segregation protein Spo0J
MATKKTVENPEFLYIPVANVVSEGQVRSRIDVKGDAFTALKESIKTRGILEPILVMPYGDNYKLLCGERRFFAAYELGMESVPARLVNGVTRRDEILAYQLTENLLREDLTPIDQAKGILAFFQAKHPDKGYDVDGLMNDLVRYERRREDIPEEIACTVQAICQITVKSVSTLFRTLSLLKLPRDIQRAVADGTLPVSQGYLFAANLDCPDLSQILEQITTKPVTNATLQGLLAAYKKAKPAVTPVDDLSKHTARLKSIGKAIQDSTGTYTKPTLAKFMEELEALVALVQQQIETASTVAVPASTEPQA